MFVQVHGRCSRDVPVRAISPVRDLRAAGPARGPVTLVTVAALLGVVAVHAILRVELAGARIRLFGKLLRQHRPAPDSVGFAGSRPVRRQCMSRRAWRPHADWFARCPVHRARLKSGQEVAVKVPL